MEDNLNKDSNSNWKDQINEIINNKSNPSDTAWTYTSICSPSLSPLIYRILMLILRIPIQAQFQKIIKDLNAAGYQEQQVETMVWNYWENLIISITLPGINRSSLLKPVFADSLNTSESLIWDSFFSLLKERGIELTDLKLAMETGLSDAKYKDLVWTVLLAGFGIAIGNISDQELHEAYIAVYGRLKEMVRTKPEVRLILTHFVEAEGLKLNEALAIDQLMFSLTDDNRHIKDFFKVRGDTLPIFLSQVIEIMYPEDNGDDNSK